MPRWTQLQEKYLAKKTTFYFAFVDLEKAFDPVLRDVLWCALRKLFIEEKMRTVQPVYRNSWSCITVNGTFSDGFLVQVNTFFIYHKAGGGTVSEVLSHANDLALVSKTLEGLKARLKPWKGALKSKELRAHVKTKMMISIENTANVTEKGKMSCAPCRKGAASNSKRRPSSNIREVQVSQRYKRDKAERQNLLKM